MLEPHQVVAGLIIVGAAGVVVGLIVGLDLGIYFERRRRRRDP